MTLDEIKSKRVLNSLGDRLPTRNDTLAEDVIAEGKKKKKKHHTPKFVQHCVAAITNDPERLADVQAKKDGSPFAICNAQYNENKRSLAAKHAKGEHHSVTDFEKALATLRKESREDRLDPSLCVFEAVTEQPRGSARSQIVFYPQG